MGLFRRSLDYEPEGEYVTAGRVRKIEDVLDEDEEVSYLIRGPTVDVDRSDRGEGTASSGNGRRRIVADGWARVGITDRGIRMKVPRRSGEMTRSFPYEEITAVDLSISIERTDLDSRYEKKRLRVRTSDSAYYVTVDEPGKAECRDAVRFARQRIDDESIE